MLLSGAVTTKVESGAMSVNVVINGVAADRTGEVEREVHKAVEDSIATYWRSSRRSGTTRAA
jgi:hypothetical protein